MDTLSHTERAVIEAEVKTHCQILYDNLQKSGFAESFTGEEAERRKQMLEQVATTLPKIAHQLLARLLTIARDQQLDPGKVTLFAAGGRVLATPIKENTDFDLVCTAEKPLNPFGKHSNITLEQRKIIREAVRGEVDIALQQNGLSELVGQGLIEIKGFGEHSASQQLELNDEVLKICELE